MGGPVTLTVENYNTRTKEGGERKKEIGLLVSLEQSSTRSFVRLLFPLARHGLVRSTYHFRPVAQVFGGQNQNPTRLQHQGTDHSAVLRPKDQLIVRGQALMWHGGETGDTGSPPQSQLRFDPCIHFVSTVVLLLLLFFFFFSFALLKLWFSTRLKREKKRKVEKGAVHFYTSLAFRSCATKIFCLVIGDRYITPYTAPTYACMDTVYNESIRSVIRNDNDTSGQCAIEW